jgi:hypothetical protein
MSMIRSEVSKIPFLVISKTETYRSKSLVSYLEKENVTNIHIRGIPAADVSIEVYNANFKNKTGISKLEIAVGVSHIEARAIGLSMKTDWVFILEDDAIIIDREIFNKTVADAVSYFDSNQPTAITFFAGQFGIFKRIHKNSKYLKALKVPDYTVATLYSRKALEVSNQSSNKQFGQMPDWPPVLKRDLRWVAIEGLYIDHPAVDDPQSPSHIRHERLNRQGQNNIDIHRVKNIFRYLMFLTVKPFSSPFVWGTIETEKLRSRILWF